MADRKPWTPQEDKCLIHLAQDARQDTGQKLRWGDIAIQLQKIGSKRSGKQCRQRWHNQLKPGIDNEREWSAEQQKILFRQQSEHGNRWALIAKALPGRTDNNIKNYFYSTLRKALRKINAYVTAHKKEQRYRNVKEFKSQNLNKILSVAQSKYEQKINLKNQQVITVAKTIKNMLVEIQFDQTVNPLQPKCPIVEQAVDQILEFNRNCKRRKAKKKDFKNQEEEGQDQHSQNQESKQMRSIQEQRFQKATGKRDKRSSKAKRKVQAIQDKQLLTKQQEGQFIDFVDQLLIQTDNHNFHQQNKQTQVNDSGKMSADREVGRISSSGNNLSSIYERSSSLNGFPAGPLAANQQNQQLNLIDLMPIYESRRAEELHGGLFLQQNSHNLQPLPFLDQTRGFNPFEEDNRVLGYLQSKRKMTGHDWRSPEMDQQLR